MSKLFGGSRLDRGGVRLMQMITGTMCCRLAFACESLRLTRVSSLECVSRQLAAGNANFEIVF